MTIGISLKLCARAISLIDKKKVITCSALPNNNCSKSTIETLEKGVRYDPS